MSPFVVDILNLLAYGYVFGFIVWAVLIILLGLWILVDKFLERLKGL